MDAHSGAKEIQTSKEGISLLRHIKEKAEGITQKSYLLEEVHVLRFILMIYLTYGCE